MSFDQLLAHLEGVQLLRRLIDPEPTYTFKHTLTQETAYHSLLVKRRREIHGAVARSYEQLFPDRLDEYAALLAQHYDEAGEDEKTLAYAQRAGVVAAHIHAHIEAIQHFNHALRVASRLATDSAQITSVYLSRGRSLELLGSYPEALTSYEEMERAAQQRNDQSMELAALVAQGTALSTPTPIYSPDIARALSHRAVALAQAIHDQAAESKALWNLMLAHFFAGLPAESAAYGERALALARQLNSPDQLAMILNDLGRAYTASGHISRAWKMLEESRQIWETLDNLPMRAENLGNFGEIFLLAGEYDRSLETSAEAYRISQSIGNSWGMSYALMPASVVHFDRGEFDQAIADMQASIAHAEQVGFAPALIYERSQLGLTYGLLGFAERGIDVAKEALETADRQLPVVRQTPIGAIALLHIARGDLQAAQATLGSTPMTDQKLVALDMDIHLLAVGELALARGDYPHAIESMDAMVAVLDKYGMRPFRADALFVKGSALLAQDRIEEAKTVLGDAKREAEGLRSHRSLIRILPALAEAERRLGNSAGADTLRRQFRTVIDAILSHISEPELRAGFVGRWDRDG